jgi:long-subunit acyl-CoA synthetase (AMP-forming)
VSLIEQMRTDLGFDTVITAYGLTEACGFATMCRRGDDAVTIATTSGGPCRASRCRWSTTTARRCRPARPARS